MFFDTHAHYDDGRFDSDRRELLSSMPEAGVELIVDPATDLPSAAKAREIAHEFDFVYFAAGVHPHEAKDVPGDYLRQVAELTEDPKCVAVGEIGLDYHYDLSPREEQRRVFRELLSLAASLKKPVIIHSREATQDTLDILHDAGDARGVVHCYSGSWETARELLDMGLYLSFTGVITYKSVRKVLEVIEKMPPERMMIETDSPYLTPVPYRKERNSSLYLHCVAETIAAIRGVTVEEVAALTLANGRRLFFGEE